MTRFIRQGIAILLCFSLFNLNMAYAQSNVHLTDIEIFNKCYLKMFKTVIPRTPTSLGASLLKQVIEKKLTGPTACSYLLGQSEFDNNGTMKLANRSDIPKLSDLENQTLISTFHDFHNSWFSQRALTFDLNNNLILRDNDEPALYLTRSLFAKNVNLSTFFTSNKTLQGKRIVPDMITSAWQSKTMNLQNEADYAAQYPGQFVLSYGENNQIANLGSIPLGDDRVLTFGKLIGVREAISLVPPVVRLLVPQTNNTAQRAELAASINSKKNSVDVFEHMGGGVLGSQMYIMKNTNLTVGQMMPGPNNDPDEMIPRRLASRVFEDLLCHQIPTLTENDIPDSEINTSSKHGFRQSKSCMACHSSIDPLAYNYRNVLTYRTATNVNATAEVQAFGTPINGATRLPSNNQSDLFSLKNPTGTLKYRDHLNKLVNTPVNGIADLGNKLANSDDFYRCVAKRYYEFFTGINVQPAERMVTEESNNDLAKFHRQKVYSIAQHLKTSQNLSSMIEEILNSEAFVYRNYQVQAP